MENMKCGINLRKGQSIAEYRVLQYPVEAIQNGVCSLPFHPQKPYNEGGKRKVRMKVARTH